MTSSTPAPYAAALIPGMEAFLAVAQTVPLVPETIDNHRALVASFTPPLTEQIAGRPITATEVTIPRQGLPDLTATVLSRSGSTATNRAGILSIHGGGMLLGDRFFGLDDALHLVETYDVVAITPEYRLAPEHPAPAQVEDCYAALSWLAEHATDLGVDAQRIAVMGFSAGGGLTAGTALLARERGGPAIAACLMNAPMIDPSSDTVSARDYELTGAWPRGYNVTAWEAILAGNAPTEAVAPALAESLAGFPPAYVEVGGAEVFRDEAIAFASRLYAAGVPTQLQVWEGAFHGFTVFAPGTELADEATRTRFEWIKRALGLQPVAG